MGRRRRRSGTSGAGGGAVVTNAPLPTRPERTSQPLRIAYLCHYFWPEIGAPSARVLDMSREWVRRGHAVTVVTGYPNHPTGVVPREYRGSLWRRDQVQGVRVLRNYVYATPNKGFVLKTLGHLSFMVSSVLFSLFRLGKLDVIVVSSPTLFSVLSAWLLSRLKRVPYVFEVRDLWPAIFVDLGVLRNRRLIALLERLELALYRNAAAVVTVTDHFRANIVSRGIAASKVSVITNGADLAFFSRPVNGDALRAEWGLHGRFVVLYIGAHGISHGLLAVLHAAEELKTTAPDVQVVMVGEGAEKDALLAYAAAKALDNVTFVPGQPHDRVPEIYAASDVCLVPLRDIPLFDGFIPSKMFEMMAAGRPIIGSVRGEARSILERSAAAVLVAPEDPRALAEAVIGLRHDPARLAAMAANGHRFVAENYSRAELARRYETILTALATGPTPGSAERARVR